MANKAAFSERFISWYNGVSTFGEDAPEAVASADAERVISDARGVSDYSRSGSANDADSVEPYHNRTIMERFRLWRHSSGAKAFRYFNNTLSALFSLCLFFVLLTMAGFLPPFGSPDNPAHNEVSRRYVEQGLSETGAVNVVAGMILDYRGFDTFGESCVLFVAVCAVLALLRNEERDAFDEHLHEMEESTHDVILMQISRIIAPMIAVFAVYVIANGHLSPGGGFSGGAILGSAMIIFACSFGTVAARRVLSYDHCRKFMTGALLFYALIKGLAIYTGANDLLSGLPLGAPGNIFSAGLLLPLNFAVGLIVAFTMYILYVLFSEGVMR